MLIVSSFPAIVDFFRQVNLGSAKEFAIKYNGEKLIEVMGFSYQFARRTLDLESKSQLNHGARKIIEYIEWVSPADIMRDSLLALVNPNLPWRYANRKRLECHGRY